MALAIRNATEQDFPRIDELFNNARAFMVANGNLTQWTNGFPNAQAISKEVENKHAFVCYDEETGEVVGVYTLANYEPAYDQIKEKWSADQDYVVIHRLATVQGKGVGKFIFKYLINLYPYIRIDTHEDNKPMLHLMDVIGFKFCGTVYYEHASGGYRVAYDLISSQAKI